MKLKSNKEGFTLIEILVAMTIITLVFGMVYGTHSAISRAIRSYNARRELLIPAKNILLQMARQIRCSYVPSQDSITKATEPVALTNNPAPEKNVNYFSASDKPESILRLVTTSGNSSGNYASAGLFEVAYKFNEAEGTLLYRQRQFAAAAVNNDLGENWRPVAAGIDKIVFNFFDGKTWRQNWDWQDRQKLPEAVSIEISLKDARNVQYKYETIAYVWFAENQRNQIESKQLASVRKQ